VGVVVAGGVTVRADASTRPLAVGLALLAAVTGFLAWWLARTYHLSQIPGMFRKLRAVIDWTVSLPFKRDLSEVGSIGHPRPLRDQAYELGGSHRPLDAD